MRRTLISTVKMVDELMSRTYISIFKEKNSLIAILLHELLNDKNEIKLNMLDPRQAITTSTFCRLIEYYLEHNYLFISPQDILNGLESDRKYILVTFDDGYYNNHLASPVLQEYQVPATFFISANHVAENECFWWDVIYRERMKRQNSFGQIYKEIAMLKQKKNDAIRKYIVDAFGEKALHPIGDIDRSFTPYELNKFSKEQFVTLGNHTNNHAILTNYSPSEIKSEILNAQNSIASFTGIKPIIISYPNGSYSKEVLTISKECGLQLGITTNGHKNYLPININGLDPFLLNRFRLWVNRDVDIQCSSFRSDIQFIAMLRNFINARHGY